MLARRFTLLTGLALLVIAACRGPSGRLASAVDARDHAAVKQLLAEGKLDPYEALEDDDISFTALGYAAHAGDVETARMLLDAGVDPNRAPGAAVPALYAAGLYRQFDVIELLLARGATPHLESQSGTTPLDALLGGKGCDTVTSDDEPRFAAVAKLMLDKGLDPNGKGSQGSHIRRAIECHHPEVVKVLIAAGASTGPERGERFTLAEAAARAHMPDALAALAAAGAETTSGCVAILDSLVDVSGGDPRLVSLAKAGDACAKRALAEQLEVLAGRRKRPTRKIEAPTWDPNAKPTASAAPPPDRADVPDRGRPARPSRSCSSNATACGGLCCPHGESYCCASDDTGDGVMCIAHRAGRGCPWGTHRM